LDWRWELDRDALCLDSSTLLGEGEFGRVVKATLATPAGAAAASTVAVKMLKGCRRSRHTTIPVHSP